MASAPELAVRSQRVSWAAVEKSPGFTPEGLIAEIRRDAHYPAAERRALVTTTEPLDPHIITTLLRAALDEAEAFVARMPTDKSGLLFLQSGKVVQPDPDRLERYQTHAGQRRGHWPSSGEITAAMFERYNKPPIAEKSGSGPQVRRARLALTTPQGRRTSWEASAVRAQSEAYWPRGRMLSIGRGARTRAAMMSLGLESTLRTIREILTGA